MHIANIFILLFLDIVVWLPANAPCYCWLVCCSCMHIVAVFNFYFSELFVEVNYHNILQMKCTHTFVWIWSSHNRKQIWKLDAIASSLFSVFIHIHYLIHYDRCSGWVMGIGHGHARVASKPFSHCRSCIVSCTCDIRYHTHIPNTYTDINRYVFIQYIIQYICICSDATVTVA